jgi:hypothetical protein
VFSAFCLRIAAVGEEREEEKEGAQEILAFGDPGYGFDAERVPGEQCDNECAPPDRARQSVKQDKKQSTIDAMKQDVDEVMCSGIQAEELAIEHVGQPGDRVPIKRMSIDERPNDSPPGQTGADSWIVEDVIVIVVLNEVEVSSGPIEKARQQRQEDRGAEHEPQIE